MHAIQLVAKIRYNGFFSVKNSDEKSKKAVTDAARLADELRTEQVDE